MRGKGTPCWPFWPERVLGLWVTKWLGLKEGGFSGEPRACVSDTHFSSTASRISGGAANKGRGAKSLAPPFSHLSPSNTAHHGPADSGPRPYCQC